MKTLVIDIGGTNVKLLATGQHDAVKIPSGPDMTPRLMVREVLDATAGWGIQRISIGFPAPIRGGKPQHEPVHLAKGWVRFDFEKAFGVPVRLVNDAAMQALGSYDGGKMLFMGLGTGLGTALMLDGTLIPLELAHLPYHHGKTYEESVGDAEMKDIGKKKWRKRVLDIVDRFMAAFQVDYIVLGGGNSRHMHTLPKNVRLGANANAFVGGFRLWEDKRFDSTHAHHAHTREAAVRGPRSLAVRAKRR